jgi:archaellum component FlaC
MLDKTHDAGQLMAHLSELNNQHEIKTNELFTIGKSIEDAEKELIELNGKYKRIRFEMKHLVTKINNTKTLIRGEK